MTRLVLNSLVTPVLSSVMRCLSVLEWIPKKCTKVHGKGLIEHWDKTFTQHISKFHLIECSVSISITLLAQFFRWWTLKMGPPREIFLLNFQEFKREGFFRQKLPSSSQENLWTPKHADTIVNQESVFSTHVVPLRVQNPSTGSWKYKAVDLDFCQTFPSCGGDGHSKLWPTPKVDSRCVRDPQFIVGCPFTNQTFKMKLMLVPQALILSLAMDPKVMLTR